MPPVSKTIKGFKSVCVSQPNPSRQMKLPIKLLIILPKLLDVIEQFLNVVEVKRRKIE
jgi:hypothetical protein